MSSIGIGNQVEVTKLACMTSISYLMFQNIFKGVGGRLGLVALFSGTLLQVIQGNYAIFKGYMALETFKAIFADVDITNVPTILNALQKIIPKNYFFAVFSGAICTLILRSKAALNPVVSSSVVGFVGAALPAPFDEKLKALLYLGSFVGMSNLDYTPISLLPLKTGLASAIAAAFYVVSNKAFAGVGGKLGEIAFCAVLFSNALSQLASATFDLLPFQFLKKRKVYNVLGRITRK
jgi:hypothetical protein